MSINLIIHDEVNCQFEGLDPSDLQTCIEALKLPVKGAYTTAAYRAGVWDGKESLMDEMGVTYNYLIDKVADVLELQCGVDVDTISIDDRRKEIDFSDIKPIGKDYLKDYLGYDLRDYQVDITNASFTEMKGIAHAATSSGKSAIILAISRLLDPYLKSLIIVPSATLAKQTYADYQKTDLAESTVMLSSVKPPEREDTIRNHRHIILTTKLFQNHAELFDEDYALIYDEAHILGDVTMDNLRYELGHCPVRFGFTGSLPTDKLKLEKLKCLMGGDVIERVSSNFLVENDYASSFTVHVVTTSDKSFESELDEISNDPNIEGSQVYTIEDKYLLTNQKRIAAIADYLKSLDLSENTLILCKPQLGKELALHFDVPFIDKDSKTDIRDDVFAQFDEHESDVLVIASFGTSSTGISKNQIYRLVKIDVGKDETTILQSIGRGMRLDGERNEFEVIDISANTKYSTRHRKERLKVYDRESYPYKLDKNFIMVD